jgi:tetratricopeptide (TPR) repeat protein
MKGRNSRTRAKAAGATPAPGESQVLASRERLVLVSALAFVWILWLAGMLLPSNWVWGVDVLAFWPPLPAALLIGLGGVALLPASASRVGQALAWLGRRWQNAGWRGDALVAASMGGLLFLLRDRLRFTGDFGVRVGVLGMQNPGPQLRELMFPLDAALNYHLPRALVASGWSPEAALQLVGAVFGAVFVLIAGRFLRATGARGAALPAGLLVICGGALLTHFAGYDKFGPLLVGLALAALGTVYMARAAAGVWVLAGGAVLAVLAHRSGLLLLPATAWAMVEALRAARRQSAQASVIGAAAVVAGAAVVVAPTALGVFEHVDLVKHLPAGSIAAARGAAGAWSLLFKPLHVLNALLFLVPLWPAAAVALALGLQQRGRGQRPQAGKGPRLGPPTALALATYLSLVLVIEPGGGWARDWDTATGAGTLLAFLAGYALVRVWGRGSAPGTEGVAAGLSLCLCVAIWGGHVSESVSSRRLESLVRSAPSWSAARRSWMYDFWGVDALKRGRAEEAARRFRMAIEIGGPNPRLYYQLGLAQLAAGNPETAGASFSRAAAGNPQAADPWVGLVTVALARGDTLAAVGCLDSALGRSPNHAEGLRLWRALQGVRSGGHAP